MSVLNKSEQIGRYKIQNLIKSNLYTETYRIEDEDNNPFFLKLFALKKLPRKLLNTKTSTVKEIEYCQRLRHQNLVSYIENGSIEREDGSYQYYVTNYFDGAILADEINRNGRLSEDEALRIFKGILKGLSYLHNQSPSLCHNDLDVSNIIISETNNKEPEIIDLGHLSERCSGSVWFDTSDLNPLYHATETMVGIFDEQGDIFSACAILYCMLTGHAPWDTEIDKSAEYKEQFKALNSFRKSHSLDLGSIKVSDKTKFILNKGLKLKNLDRFEHILEILSVLDSDNTYNHREENRGAESSTYEDKSESGRGSSFNDPNPVDFEIKRGGGNGFKDIAGMEILKDYLQKKVIFVIKDKETAQKYGLTPPNGLLLYGPPGCGKTYFAEKFAEETGFNFLLVKSSDLGSSFVHGSQEKINKLFKLSERNSPIVLCFDEFDALVPDRSAPGSQYVSSEVNEFLSQMNNCSKRGIFIVATSNRPDKIDPAILRTGRIDKQVYVPLPDSEARKEMFKLYLNNRPVEDNINVDELANMTEGYIASDIAFIVNDAAMTAAYSRELISNELLKTSINNICPSLRKESVDIYNNIREKMENVGRQNVGRVIVNPF